MVKRRPLPSLPFTLFSTPRVAERRTPKDAIREVHVSDMESQDFPDPQPEDHADHEHSLAGLRKSPGDQPNFVERQRASRTHGFDGWKFDAARRVLVNPAVPVCGSERLAEHLADVVNRLR